ncbi:hypothetical protein GCM10020220_047870 [Nonomuraea rubra]
MQHAEEVDGPAQPVELAPYRALGVGGVVQVGVEAAGVGEERLDEVVPGPDGAGDAAYGGRRGRGEQVEPDVTLDAPGPGVDVRGRRRADLVPPGRERHLVPADLQHDRRAAVLVAGGAHLVRAAQPRREIDLVTGRVRGSGKHTCP